MSIAPISSERGVFSEGGVRLLDQGKGAPAFAGRAGVNQAIAARHGAGFLDAGTLATVDPVDGIHLMAEGHAALGAAMATKVREMVG